MIIGQMTQKAEIASQRYNWFTMGLASLHSRGVGGIDGGSAAWTQGLMTEARDLALVYLDTEVGIIMSDLSEIAQNAHRATLSEIRSNDSDELTVAALEHIQASGDYLRDELLAQIARDIATLRKSIQKTNLEIGLIARARNEPLRATALQKASTNAGPDFVFHDRASRKWSSKTFVRTTWRHTLLSVYNEVVLLTLADHGIGRAQVTHQDPAHEYHDMVLTIDEVDGYSTYGELRDVVFHPNAHAVLRMEMHHVSA